MQQNPWDNDPIVGNVTQSVDGHPLIIKPAQKPDVIPGSAGQTFGPGGVAQDIPNFKPAPPAEKVTYRPMTADEKTAQHLSPDAPWLMGSNGDFKLPDGYKPNDDSNKATVEKQQNLDAADSLIQAVHKARSYITDADTPVVGNTATGLGFKVLKHSPLPTDASKLDAVINQEIRGNIFLKRIADLKESSDSPTGGTGIGRIMQSEIPLITGAIGTLDPGKLGKEETLNSLLQIERSALRSKAAINGENPDDPAVQQKYGIPPLPQYPGGALPGATPPASGDTPPSGPTDNGITPSNQPPAIGPTGSSGAALSGSEQAVTDPNLAKIAPQLEQYLAADPKKISNAMILGFMKKNGVDPSNTSVEGALQFRMSPDGEAWRKRGGNYGVDPTYNVPLSGVAKTRAEFGASSAGAAAIHAGDGLTAGLVGPLTGTTNDMNRALVATSVAHPGASLAGDVAGSVPPIIGGEAALAKLGMKPGPLRSALANATYGAVAGGSRGGVNGAVTGAAAGAAGGVAGEAIPRGLGAVIKGVTSPTIGYVAKDVPLTIGQAVGQSGLPGKITKGVEDRLSGVPVIGDTINARRLEGLQKMNSAAFDRALQPIGEKANGEIGEQAVADAQDKVSKAFSNALAGKSAGLDRGFIADATKAKMGIDKLPDSVRGEVNNQIDHVINNYFDDGGQISGENMQALLRDLGGIKRSYQGTPLGHRIGLVVDQFSSSVENLFRRQAPDVMPQYDAAKQAFKRVSTLEDAVLKAKNTGGVFTPGQLGLADRANTIKYGGKHTAAAGGGEFHDFQRNMQDVLPNKVPDSGTAGRLLVPAALIGAGAGIGEEGGDTEKGLTLGALLALAYSKAGQRALTASVLKRGTALRAAGSAVQKSSRAIGHAAAGAAALDATRD